MEGNKMKIGVLGLGARGQSLIKNAILPALQEYNMEKIGRASCRERG